MKDRTIYILLSHSGSMFSKAINICTREPYTHASIALDENLMELYSFGRLYPYNPVIAGFVREDIINGTYKRFPNTRCKLYSLTISELQYAKLRKELEKFTNGNKKYRYNFLGVISAAFDYPLERENKYFCSQFVSKILINSGIPIVNKDPGLTAPMDFMEYSGLQLIYEGYLRGYSQQVVEEKTMQLSNIN